MSIIDDAIRSAAEAYGIDPNLLRAQAWAESRNNPSAVSPAGAQGLMQIMPGTGKELGLKDPYDPWQSAYAGAKYLGQQLRRFDGDTDKALAAYNAGPGRVLQYGGVPPFKETQDYIKRINSRRELLNTIDGTLQIGSPSKAFIDNDEEPPRQFPQGEIPQPEASQQVPEYTPQWRSKIDQYGQATADKIGEALGAFDFRAQTERRNEFSRKVADYYGGADDMGPADVPGAVLAAPVNLLRNALGPIRRALGNRQQASTDALSGPFGAQLVAAATGDPSVAEAADETPGAGQVLKDLFTDARERRAQAVRASLQGLGAYDKLMERQGKALSQQLSGLDSLSQALGNNALTYGRMADAERGRFATNADIRRTDAMAQSHYQNALLDRSRRMTQDVETRLAQMKAALIEQYGPVEAEAKIEEIRARINSINAQAEGREAGTDLTRTRIGTEEERTRTAKATADILVATGLPRAQAEVMAAQGLAASRRAQETLLNQRRSTEQARTEGAQYRTAQEQEQLRILQETGLDEARARLALQAVNEARGRAQIGLIDQRTATEDQRTRHAQIAADILEQTGMPAAEARELATRALAASRFGQVGVSAAREGLIGQQAATEAERTRQEQEELRILQETGMSEAQARLALQAAREARVRVQTENDVIRARELAARAGSAEEATRILEATGMPRAEAQVEALRALAAGRRQAMEEAKAKLPGQTEARLQSQFQWQKDQDIREEVDKLDIALRNGTISPALARQRLVELGLDRTYRVNDTYWRDSIEVISAENPPEQPGNKPVAAPTGNVGGAEGASSSQSPALDDAIKSGKIDLSQFATPKDLVAAMKADPATYTDDVVMHIRRQKNWD